jgi:hypothetical protein
MLVPSSGAHSCGSVGCRVFDVDVEGKAMKNFDIVKQAGDSFTATTAVSVASVSDGFVTIRLSGGGAKISAIEVYCYVPTKPPTRAPTRQPTRSPTRKPSGAPTRKPSRAPTRKPSAAPTRKPSSAPTRSPTRKPSRKPSIAPTSAPTNTLQYCKPIRINSGGADFTDAKGQLWIADKFFQTGHTWSNNAKAISNTADDALYQSERAGDVWYSIPVGPGEYRVVLHFAEI